MALHRHWVEHLPPGRRTFYSLVAACAALGLALIAVSLATRNGPGIWAGLGAVAGAAAGVVLMQAVDRLARDAERASRQVDELAARLERLEHMVRGLAASEERKRPASPGPEGDEEESPALDAGQWVDIPSGSCKDAARITAATLDRDRFPRLASLLREDARASEAAGHEDPRDSAVRGRAADDHSSAIIDGVGNQNLRRAWQLALRDGDLCKCRSLLPALTETREAAQADAFERQFQALADRTERVLRDEFSHRVRCRDLEGVLEVGERICTLLPDRPAAEEFRRLKPQLVRRLNSGPPSVRGAAEDRPDAANLRR